MKKVTRHIGLDSKAEQIIEDWDITDYEIQKACDTLDNYWNDQYQELMARLEMLPAELFDIKHDFEQQGKKKPTVNRF